MKGSRKLGLVVVIASSVAALALATACSSDPEVTPSPTAEAGSDSTSTPVDGGSDTSSQTDAPSDGGVDAAKEAAVPPLCATYKDISADASAVEGPRRLYELIALRALVEAMDSCEIGAHFGGDIEDPPPSLITCFGKQIAMVAGCNLGGAPIDYAKEIDENGARCVPSAVGANTVQLGFRNPATSGYSGSDVDYMLSLVRAAALSTGMPAADADKRKALVATQRSNVTDGGPDSGFSNSSCP